ncbi:ABC transporter substrate-binding protein [Nocardioides humi]|nr:ABC transporter substrate-binding protein [Nocardioides humi]
MGGRRLAAGLVALVLGAAVLAACDGGGSGSGSSSKPVDVSELPNKMEPASGPVDSVTWNISPQPTSLGVPGFSENNYAPQSIMCDHLVALDGDWNFVPHLATELRWETPTRLVMPIQEGVTYWDGTPLTADDVVWNLNHVMDPAVAPTNQANVANVESVTKTGDNEVTVEFTQHDSTYVATVLATNFGAIHKPSVVQEKGDAYGTAAGGIMCSGPFEYESWQTGESMTMTANPDYWNDDYQPLIQKLTIRFVSDPNALASALLSGEIDGAYNLPLSITSRLEGASNGTLQRGKSVLFDVLIPVDQSGPLADVRLRKALSLAIDREAVAKVGYAGYGHPNVQAVSSPSSFTYGGDVFKQQVTDKLDYLLEPDLEQAKGLVDDAGAPSRPLTLVYTAGDPVHEKAASVIQQSAAQAGIDIELAPKDPTELLGLLTTPDARAGVDLWLRMGVQNAPDPLVAIVSGYVGKGVLTFGHENSAAFDLISQARAEPDDDARAELTAQALFQMTDEDAFPIPLVYRDNTLFLNERLGGAWLNNPYWEGPWAAVIGAK